jgi:drug/metabolite transporter (DMT)-like permease
MQTEPNKKLLQASLELESQAGIPTPSQENTPETLNQGKDQRYLGYIWQVIFIVQLCLQHFFGKLLFMRHTELSAVQMLLLRSVVASVIFLFIMKMDVSYYLWKSIPAKYWKDLVSRVMQGLVLMVAIYTSIKNFPLVYVSLVSNMTPLLTAVASYFLIKKGLSKLDTAILVVSFIGVTLLITGSPTKEA